MRCVYLLAFYLFLSLNGSSQNITGTWEGMMGSEFLQVNIVQRGDDLCGYTYDYESSDKKNYCRAYFSGKYNREKKEWRISGSSFFQNSGTHILMRLRLWLDDMDDDRLQGMEYPKGFLNVLSLGMGTPLTLKKVSSKPTKLPGGKDPCPEEEPVKKDNAPDPRDLAPNKKIPPPVEPEPKREPAPVIKKDTTKKPEPVVVVKPPVVKKDTVAVKPPLRVTERSNKAIRTLEVNVKTITLKVYDNATVDGDTVSIYYDGKLLVNKKGLSVQPIELTIELDEHSTKHELILYAENLGSIPPNTALIVVTAGEKRYELFASASLEENAVLIFEYKPK